MFRPIPEPLLFRKIPHRLIACALLTVALVVIVVLLFSLEPGKILVQGFIDDNAPPPEAFPALWQFRRDLVLVMLLILLVGAVSIAAVITFLHHESTKRRLEEVKGLARNILQSIPTGVLTVNDNGVITAVNPSAEAVWKRSAADLLGKTYETVFSRSEPVRHVLDGALRSRRHAHEKDVLYESRDGSLHTIRVSTVELKGDGQSAGVLLQAQDVTEWLVLEQRVRVAEKLTALHTLSAGVAHELRNPLSAMDLNLHLLEDTLKDRGLIAQDTGHYLQVLNAECRRLTAILDHFMKFARPGPTRLHEVDLSRVIQHIVALMRFEAEERGIRLEYTVEPDFPPILADETQISQVLVNVLVNAFQATRDGHCRIVARSQTVDGQRVVDVAVHDTGTGIPQDAMSRLFEPFYTTKADGTGLGLAIAYRIMQDHGGSISASSVPGKGTTVILRLPASATEAQPVETAP
ncbi:MAG TPA: ATP-binding protein [Nitrospira sp.]|nr:ATP-binding protein [Nitrospira sp.]